MTHFCLQMPILKVQIGILLLKWSKLMMTYPHLYHHYYLNGFLLKRKTKWI